MCFWRGKPVAISLIVLWRTTITSRDTRAMFLTLMLRKCARRWWKLPCSRSQTFKNRNKLQNWTIWQLWESANICVEEPWTFLSELSWRQRWRDAFWLLVATICVHMILISTVSFSKKKASPLRNWPSCLKYQVGARRQAQLNNRTSILSFYRKFHKNNCKE